MIPPIYSYQKLYLLGNYNTKKYVREEKMQALTEWKVVNQNLQTKVLSAMIKEKI